MVLLMLLMAPVLTWAGQLRVAVASNFLITLQQLATDFKQQSGHELIISSGSTGQLFAQIIQGAPHDVFMAADKQRPQMLVDAGLATGLQIYAQGQLVLFSNLKTDGICAVNLLDDQLQHLAIANPDLAPYGLAARQYLEHKGWWVELQPSLVMGENVSQAMQMVATRNATAGLVAKSMLSNYRFTDNQCVVEIPTKSHQPIEQGMVLLNRSDNEYIYQEFAKYLASDAALTVLKDSGYVVGENDD